MATAMDAMGEVRKRARGEAAGSRLLAILALLVGVDVLLFGLHLGSYHAVGRVLGPVNMGMESNLPTWWSSMQLLLAGCCFALVAVRCWAVSTSARWLGLVALVLAAMSLDEFAQIHEKLGEGVDLVIGDRSETAFSLTGLWFAVIGVPFAAFMAVVIRRLWRFLGEMPGARSGLAAGFAVLLAGALGVEALNNFVLAPDPTTDPSSYSPFVLVIGIEELLEMIGGSILLWTGLRALMGHWSTRQIADALRPLPAAERSATAN